MLIAGRLAPCDGMRQQGAMKTSITWSPAAGLSVISVERREQAWTVTVDSRQPTFCPRCCAQRYARNTFQCRSRQCASEEPTRRIWAEDRLAHRPEKRGEVRAISDERLLIEASASGRNAGSGPLKRCSRKNPPKLAELFPLHYSIAAMVSRAIRVRTGISFLRAIASAVKPVLWGSCCPWESRRRHASCRRVLARGVAPAAFPDPYDLTCATVRLPAGGGFRSSASGRVRSSQVAQSSRLRITICRSWIGATSGPGWVVSSVKAPPPSGIGRHLAREAEPVLAGLRELPLGLRRFFPVNS